MFLELEDIALKVVKLLVTREYLVEHLHTLAELLPGQVLVGHHGDARQVSQVTAIYRD